MKKMKSGCIKRQMEIDEIEKVGKCKLVLFFVSIFIFIKEKKKRKKREKGLYTHTLEPVCLESTSDSESSPTFWMTCPYLSGGWADTSNSIK
jgi:hypothetical protein